ncbi:MAG: helix-hairpin-helix domain-containing protein [Bacillota bacterium]
MLQILLDKYKIPLIILIASIVVIFTLLNRSSENTSENLEEDSLPIEIIPAEEEQQKEAEPVNKEIFVDVKGAVLKPGIYKAVQSERVNDLIIRAGGFTAAALEESVNLAQKVSDEMVIYVPEEGEAGVLPAVTVTGLTEGEEMLNINVAEAQEFENLPGIGPAKARAIFDYRTENGPFKTIEELMEVSGIGQGTFDKLKDNVTVN